MGAIGIVAEYNPFHSGHAHHIRETRRSLGADRAIVAVMSGNWVQRGECALCDKWLRARQAVQQGADLVLELPTVFAMRGAETFARGAVEVLRRTGVVDALSFGLERGTAEELNTLARCLSSPGYERALGDLAGEKNLPFAARRQQAVSACLGEELGELLSLPNCNLAVEYLRAAAKEFEVCAVPRVGAGHDRMEMGEGFASASALRGLLRGGDLDRANPYLPSPWQLETAVAQMKWGERAILSRLRGMKEEDWARLPDSGGEEGLPQRLVREAGARTLEEFYIRVKTKRYSHARLRRLSLWAFLTGGEMPPERPEYLRLLALNDRGRQLLAQMGGRASLPVLTKAAHVKALGPGAEVAFQAEAGFTDQYGLFFQTVRPMGLEWTMSPHFEGG